MYMYTPAPEPQHPLSSRLVKILLNNDRDPLFHPLNPATKTGCLIP